MTSGMVSISRREPSSSRTFAGQLVGERKRIFVHAGEYPQPQMCTTSTSSPPRLSDSSSIWSIMLIMIESLACFAYYCLGSWR